MAENENLVTKEDTTYAEIRNLIYTVRGKQIMLDSDVAMLYHHETKRVNETVRRNIERFPENFCFQLTEEEYQSLRFHFGTLNEGNMRFHFGTASNER